MTDLPVIRTYDDLVEVFRARKAELGLSNKTCDGLLNRGDGYTDHHIGTADKGIGPVAFILFCELFALEFVPRPNLEAAKRMADQWERRNNSALRINAHSISKRVIERVKPILYAEKALQLENGRKKIPQNIRRRIARRAARIRWGKTQLGRPRTKAKSECGADN